MRILAINGSLRTGLTNGALLRAAGTLAPAGMQVDLYEGLGALPHFNPDLDAPGMTPPPSVAEFRALIANAQGVLISSPEYAHGVPGALKNALDWAVSGNEFTDKPVVLWNAAPTGGEHAHAALRETLVTMGAKFLDDACLRAPLVRRQIDAQGKLTDAALAGQLTGSLVKLAAIRCD